MTKGNRVYRGKSAISDFLNPHSHPDLPLVELPPELNPFYDKGVHVFAKLMTQLPLGNVKSVPAYNMLAHSDLSETDELIEASSGNTVLSLAVTAKSMGIHSTRALVSREVSKGKLMLLRLCGVTVEVVDEPICPDPGDPNGAIAQAKQRGTIKGVTNLGQYSNELNPLSHTSFTGPQIFEQLEGKVDYLAAGLGTTGTLMGVSRYFKEKSPHTRIVGIARQPNNDVPGVRTANLLGEVEFDWKEYCDVVREVGQKDSYANSLQLIRYGLFVGPSSGFALAGLFEELELAEQRGDFDDSEEINAVFICPDAPFAYMEKYFSVLSDENFKNVINAELLPQDEQPDTDSEAAVQELYIEEFISEYISIKNQKVLQIKRHHLIDVREPREFEDHHIEGSRLVPLGSIETFMSTADKNDLYVFVCRSGNRSAQACRIAHKHKISGYSLAGGTTAWSKLGLPRVTPDSCSPRYKK